VQRLLTAGEAALLLGLKRWTVWKLCRDGVLPVVRIGRSVRIDEGALRQWIADGGTAKVGVSA
jgi:excisionase family DNA binding protein